MCCCELGIACSLWYGQLVYYLIATPTPCRQAGRATAQPCESERSSRLVGVIGDVIERAIHA